MEKMRKKTRKQGRRKYSMHERHYDACEGSFKATDESRAKANAQLFDDTGLMVATCRHDSILFAVNMKTAGERQFYAIAVLLELMEHLPPDTRVGVLYDIACCLERSCIKWDYLGKELLRFFFAVSKFHAFAHGWCCQLVYHPDKRDEFGLTDGESCERKWSQLKHLIPVCRVSGVSCCDSCKLCYQNLIYVMTAL